MIWLNFDIKKPIPVSGLRISVSALPLRMDLIEVQASIAGHSYTVQLTAAAAAKVQKEIAKALSGAALLSGDDRMGTGQFDLEAS